jgi:hypothetical protein
LEELDVLYRGLQASWRSWKTDLAFLKNMIFLKKLILVITQMDLSMAQHERGAEDVGCIGRWT